MFLLEYGASWLHFLALMLGAGALSWRFAMRPAPPASFPRIDHAAVRMARGAGMLLVVAFAAIFARQVVEFRDPFVPLSDDVSLLLSTDWGTAWRWGSAGAVVALVGLFAAGRRGALGTAGWIVGGAALGVTGVYPAFTGHAASGDPRWLTIGADVLHVWAASAWIGGLGMLVVALRMGSDDRSPVPSRDTPSLDTPSLVAAFSPLALVSVTILLLTGTLASWQHLESPAALVTTAWGGLLSLKLLLVAGVLVLGARNWRRLTADLGSPDGDAAMRRSATTELLVGHLVLLVTAVLIRTSPG